MRWNQEHPEKFKKNLKRYYSNPKTKQKKRLYGKIYFPEYKSKNIEKVREWRRNAARRRRENLTDAGRKEEKEYMKNYYRKNREWFLECEKQRSIKKLLAPHLLK
jgi:pantothenate kinase-related protein Tda10